MKRDKKERKLGKNSAFNQNLACDFQGKLSIMVYCLTITQ